MNCLHQKPSSPRGPIKLQRSISLLWLIWLKLGTQKATPFSVFPLLLKLAVRRETLEEAKMAIARTGVYVDDYLECKRFSIFSIPRKHLFFFFFFFNLLMKIKFGVKMAQTQTHYPLSFRGSSIPFENSMNAPNVNQTLLYSSIFSNFLLFLFNFCVCFC